MKFLQTNANLLVAMLLFYFLENNPKYFENYWAEPSFTNLLFIIRWQAIFIDGTFFNTIVKRLVHRLRLQLLTILTMRRSGDHCEVEQLYIVSLNQVGEILWPIEETIKESWSWRRPQQRGVAREQFCKPILEIRGTNRRTLLHYIDTDITPSKLRITVVHL